MNTHPDRFGSAAREDGIALLLVLLFILLLSAIVVEYAYEAQVDASLVANGTQDFQAYLAAKSAVATALESLEEDLIEPQLNDPNNPNNRNKPAAAAKNQPQTGYAGDYDGFTDLWAQGIPCQQVNDAVLQCRVVDECGKINLNALLVNETQTNPALENALRTLFKDLGLEQDPTDAILDWIDPDDDARPDGAESDFYESSETPYACKNGPMDSIEELLLIKGIPPEIFFNCYAVEQSASQKDSKKKKKSSKIDVNAEEPLVTLPDLLTVHGAPRGTINVNTAAPEVLYAVFGSMENGNPAVVDAILERRMAQPFESIGELSEAGAQLGAQMRAPQAQTQGLQAQAAQFLDVKSQFFRIYGDGRAGDVMVRIEAYVYRAGLQDRAGANPNNTVTPPKDGKQAKQTGSNQSAFGAPSGGGAPMEAFRFLDWRVIR